MKHYRSIAAVIGILAILLSAFPSRSVQADGGDEGFEREANGYQVNLHFKGHAKTGENPVDVRIVGVDGQPVDGLTVELSAEPGAAHGEEASDEAVEPHPDETGEDSHDDTEEPHDAAETEMPADMQMQSGAEHTPQPPEEPIVIGTPQPGDQADAHTEGETVGDVDEHNEEESSEDSGIEPCTVDSPCTESEAHAEDEEDGDHTEGEEAGGHGEGKSLLKPAEEAGVYEGEIFFPESGDWAVKVRFAISDGSVDEHVDFTVDVIETGPNWPVLGGFFGINTAVMITAAVLKRKSTLVVPA